jgi:hypothetical protein
MPAWLTTIFLLHAIAERHQTVDQQSGRVRLVLEMVAAGDHLEDGVH